MSRRTHLWIECLALYGMIPLILLALQLRGGIPFFPVLLGFLGFTLLLTARSPDLRFRLSSRAPEPLLFLLRILLSAVALLALTVWLRPELLFRFPREQPRLWLTVMVLYPLLSVAPQEFLYRSFFFQRYEPLFGSGRSMIAVNALLFGWGHIFFVNWIAPVLSVLGGLLLAATWRKTRSFRWVCLEHALYGQLVFTVGIGWYFYSGSARSLEHLLGP